MWGGGEGEGVLYEPADSDCTSVGHTHKAEFASFKLVSSTGSDLPTASGQHHLELTRVIESIEHPNRKMKITTMTYVHNSPKTYQ